jgi:hypothetical protein
MDDKQILALGELRRPFEKHHISKLPKPTKAQTDEVKKDFRKGIRCNICGGWHHPKVIHVDYVGHAAATDRLLSVDPLWNWEPLAIDPITNLPLFDKDGGLWIKLTVCGMTRLGYGDSGGKSGPDAIKEKIGDAIRNAGMRFGMALDLWHKGDLVVDEVKPPDAPQIPASKIIDGIRFFLENEKTVDELTDWMGSKSPSIDLLTEDEQNQIDEYRRQIIGQIKGGDDENNK